MAVGSVGRVKRLFSVGAGTKGGYMSDRRAMALRVAAAPRRAVHLKAVVHQAACCRPGRAAVRRGAVPCSAGPAAACWAAVQPVAGAAAVVAAVAGIEAAVAAGTLVTPSYSSSIDSNTRIARDSGYPSTIRPKT